MRLNPKSRFGRGFYTSPSISTTEAELEHHGYSAVNTIRYELSSEAKILNATSPILNLGTKRAPDMLRNYALQKGYDGIIFNSVRQAGGTNVVLFKNFDLLKNGVIVH